MGVQNAGNFWMVEKGKVRPSTGTEALYRLYGSQGEYSYSSTLS